MKRGIAGLRLKTLLFIAFITILPVSGIIWMLLQSLSQASLTAESSALEQAGVLIRQELQGSVGAKAEIYDLTLKKLLIGLDGVRTNMSASGVGTERLLADYFYGNPIISRVYVLDAEGVVAAVPFITENVARGLVRTDLWSVFADRTTSVGRWIGPYTDPMTGQGVMTYAMPIREGSIVQQVLAFDVTTLNLLTRVTAIDPSVSSYTVIVRSDGTFISSAGAVYEDFDIAPDETSLLRSPVADFTEGSEVLSARDAQAGSFNPSATNDTQGKIVLYATIPTLEAKIFLVSPLDELLAVQQERVEVIRSATDRAAASGLLSAILLAALIAIATFAFTEKVVIDPLQRLMRGIVELEQSGATVMRDVANYPKDEIGELARRFDAMAAKLRESHQDLERKIEERTAELNRNLVEMERVNKLMVGRELRMQELKREIARLRDGDSSRG